MTVALLYGGRSGEHEISLVSAAAIARQISRAHDVVLIGITKSGRWFLQDKSLLEKIRSAEGAPQALSVAETPENEICLRLGAGTGSFGTVGDGCQGKSLPVEVVFPVLHGTYGEDGTVQGLLELADVPYVGCGVLASAVALDKEMTKRLWREAGLPIVPYVCLTRADLCDSARYDQIVERASAELGFPLFVKPCGAGSSDGAGKANSPKELAFAIAEAFEWDDKVLIEKAIDALEVECSVTGNSVKPAESEEEKIFVAGPGAIAPTHVFYDYDSKYNDPNGAALQIPAEIPPEAAKKIKELAALAYTALNASGMSRVDFFLDRQTGGIYLNEINTIPGFTQISMFPKLCEHEGTGFAALLDRLLSEAVARHKAKSTLRTAR